MNDYKEMREGKILLNRFPYMSVMISEDRNSTRRKIFTS